MSEICMLIRKRRGEPVERLRAQAQIAEIGAALIFTSLFFWLWPTSLVSDDAGIILKYMDNFANGYFYTYNPADGPVFGISSFLHGVLAGFFAYTHLLSPLNSLFASNYIGLFFCTLLALKILNVYISGSISLFALVVLMLSAPNLVINLKGGMETPLHLCALLACLYYLLREQPRPMFAACALAIVAKLDSVPIVLVILLGFIYQQRAALRSSDTRAAIARDALGFFVLPLCGWLAVCQAIFGGVLPQSAYAKLYYQHHPTGSWFPFIKPWLDQQRSALVLYTCAAATALYLALGCFQRRDRASPMAAMPGLMAAGYLALYYVYNPPEQHPWYYAIPEFLMRLQLLICAYLFCARIARRHAQTIFAACVAGFAVFSWPPVAQQVQASVKLLGSIEAERMAIGGWIALHSQPDDTLFSGHGHIARAAGLYTIDYSGLNSRIATDERLDFEKMIVDLKPTWIAMHGLLAERLQLSQGYQLRASFYNITTVGFPTWRVYQRSSAPCHPISTALGPGNIRPGTAQIKSSNGLLLASGQRISLEAFQADQRYSALTLGLVKQAKAVQITATIYDREDTPITTTSIVLEPASATDALHGRTREWILALPANTSIANVIIESKYTKGKTPAQATIIDPFLQYSYCSLAR